MPRKLKNSPHNLKVIGSNPIPATTFTERAASSSRWPVLLDFRCRARPFWRSRRRFRSPAILGRANGNTLDQGAKDLDRLIPNVWLVESVLESLNLLSIDLGQVRVKTYRRCRTGGEVFSSCFRRASRSSNRC